MTQGELVQKTENPFWGCFNQLTDHSVAEEPNLAPLHALGQVLLLLPLEAVLNEKLLQLFIGIIYQKLLKPVLLECLKSVDIQYSEHVRSGEAGNLEQ